MEGRTDMRVAVGTLLFMLFGPIIWSLHFATIYTVQAVTCAVAPMSTGWVRWLLGAATVLAAGAMLAAVRWPAAFAGWWGVDCWPVAQSRFFVGVMRLLALLSLFALLALGAKIAWLPPCATLR